MKISKVIALPVSGDGHGDMYDFDGNAFTNAQIDIISHAINKHDYLVEGLQLAVKEILDWQDNSGLVFADTEKLITKLQGLLEDES